MVDDLFSKHADCTACSNWCSCSPILPTCVPPCMPRSLRCAFAESLQKSSETVHGSITSVHGLLYHALPDGKRQRPRMNHPQPRPGHSIQGIGSRIDGTPYHPAEKSLKKRNRTT